jgi:hypothetical protein
MEMSDIIRQVNKLNERKNIQFNDHILTHFLDIKTPSSKRIQIAIKFQTFHFPSVLHHLYQSSSVCFVSSRQGGDDVSATIIKMIHLRKEKKGKFEKNNDFFLSRVSQFTSARSATFKAFSK